MYAFWVEPAPSSGEDGVCVAPVRFDIGTILGPSPALGPLFSVLPTARRREFSRKRYHACGDDEAPEEILPTGAL